MPSEIRTIAQTAAALRQRETTCRAEVERCLARIERFDASVRAWVSVDADGALQAADRCDRELADGHDRGPLHGIPVGIKDLFDVAGWPTRAGSTVSDASPARVDAHVVARLRAAGAIILGKTVTTEWASFDPSPTRNPWNLDHTPGGSSSGSAAAVALGMCAAAMGSQTGGSITRPATYCGVAGCKPTWSRVSLRGVVPLASHLDHPGPLARSVADLAEILQVIAGYDPADPWSSDIPVDDYRAQLRRTGPPRIGWLAGFFHDAADADARRASDETRARLRANGAAIEELPLPACFEQAIGWHRTIMTVEAAATHREIYLKSRSEFGPHISRLLDDGLAASQLDYAAALAGQRAWTRAVVELLQNVDCLAAPAATSAAPGLETTGDPRFQSVWSLAGTPTVSIPTALSPAGLPLGVQLVGRPWGEAALFGAAAWCERAVDFAARRPAATTLPVD